MDFLKHQFPLLLLHSLILLFSISITESKTPRLGSYRRTPRPQPHEPRINTASISDDFQILSFTQRLDHFNYNPESYSTFQQRYAINSKYWGGANSSAPIFVFFGEEANLEYDLSEIGFLSDNADHFKALLVFTEHRFYGKSIPFGHSTEAAMKNASTRGYFTTAQALADYAAILIHVKKTFSAKNSPIIVIGGSYGGMLAAWFRLKYPHLALGALASSAPILYFDDVAPQVSYYSIVSKDFKETSESCYETIRKSWSEIDRVASQPDGLSILSQRFKTCNKLKRSFDLKDYLDSIYTGVTQYDCQPQSYSVSSLCRAISDAAAEGSDILGQLFAGVVYDRNNSGFVYNEPCNNMDEHPVNSVDQWKWQTCTELVMPIGHEESEDSMFQPSPFNLNNYTKRCKSLFGVQPQFHWVASYYGVHDLKLIFRRFASNIIFSNGLRDPHSGGGVLEDISESVVAISTMNGSHCLDIMPAREGDPEWLTLQRKTEVETIEGWISNYYNDLAEFRTQIPA